MHADLRLDARHGGQAARRKQVVGRDGDGADKAVGPEFGRDVAVQRGADALENDLTEPFVGWLADRRPALLLPYDLGAVVEIARPAD